MRGLLQDSPKLAFAFAGLHTLQEMLADYFQPFFASVLPIKVDFFNPGIVRIIVELFRRWLVGHSGLLRPS